MKTKTEQRGNYWVIILDCELISPDRLRNINVVTKKLEKENIQNFCLGAPVPTN